jgi:hypothetical protein
MPWVSIIALLGRSSLLARLAVAVFLASAACGDGEPPDGGSGREDAATRADRGTEPGEAGVLDLGLADGGPVDGGTDAGTADGGFTPGVFDPSWSPEESTLMFLGLEGGSCGLYQSADGRRLVAEVVETGPPPPPLSGDPTWSFRVEDLQGNLVRTEEITAVSPRTLELVSRTIRLGPSTTRTDRYALLRADRPIMLELDPSLRPTQQSWTVNVEGQTLTMMGMGGSGENLPPEDHTFALTDSEVTTPRGRMMGYALDHSVDGQPVAAYELVPAFGIIAFDQEGRRFEMCDYRACSPAGCAGAAACSALACP